MKYTPYFLATALTILPGCGLQQQNSGLESKVKLCTTLFEKGIGGVFSSLIIPSNYALDLMGGNTNFPNGNQAFKNTKELLTKNNCE